MPRPLWIVVLCPSLLLACDDDDSSRITPSHYDAGSGDDDATPSGVSGDDDVSADDDDVSADDDAVDDDAIDDDSDADDDVEGDDSADDDRTDDDSADDDDGQHLDAGTSTADSGTDAVGDVDSGLGEPIATLPGQPAEPPYASGRRLHALVQEAGDAENFSGFFYDSELDRRCNFLQTGTDAEGPVYHCLPAASVVARYTDASCSSAVVPAPNCEAPLLYQLFVPVEIGCAPSSTFFEPGETTSDPSLFEINPGTLQCQAVGAAAGEYQSLVPWTPERYIEGREVLVGIDAASNFSQRFIVGADGSFIRNALLWRDEPCTPDELGGPGGARYCTPNGYASFDETFPTSDCSGDQVVGEVVSMCGGPRNASTVKSYARDSLGCFRFSSVYEVGDELPAGALYELNEGDCLAAGTPDSVYAVGSEIPASELPSLDVLSLGSGRLRSRFLASATGNVLSEHLEWFDVELNQPCTPLPFEDGTLRCVPSQRANVGRYYADDACSVELYDAFANDVCRGPLDSTFARVGSYPECSGLVLESVSELLPFDGTVYALSEEDCVVADAAADGQLVFEPVTQLFAEDFAEVVLTERAQSF